MSILSNSLYDFSKITFNADQNTYNIDVGVSEAALNFVLKTADQTSTVTTYADISNLSFSISAGQMYWFRFVIPYTTLNISYGAKFAINGPASPTFLAYQTTNCNGAGNGTVSRGLSTYDAATTSNNGVLAGNIAIVEGVIIPSSDGTLIARFGNEAGGQSNTVKAGAMVKYIQM